jgi:hypothetical protein
MSWMQASISSEVLEGQQEAVRLREQLQNALNEAAAAERRIANQERQQHDQLTGLSQRTQAQVNAAQAEAREATAARV